MVAAFRRIRDMTVETSPARVFPGRAGFLAAIAVFTGVVALGVGLSQAQEDRPPAVLVAVAGAVAIAAGWVLLRQQRALLALLGYAFAAAAGIAVVADNRSANPIWLGVCLIGGWCALVGGPRIALAFCTPAVMFFVAEWAWIKPDTGWGAWLAGTVFTALGGLLIGRQLKLVAQLRAAQAGLAAKARAEERNRISRDVHDVIAHTLTVSLLHVMSARRRSRFAGAAAVA
jgi:signal transduction histidine kinase